jgi:LysR family transcriptional regulator for bpeEF and oprC
MSRLDSMRIYTRVVSLGSFARAAAELGMSPASVTLHVQELEKELGVRLLNRTTRRSSMTEEGRIFFDHCMRMADEIEAVEERLRGSSRVEGLLRADIPMICARLLLLPALPRLLAAHPRLKLQLTMDNRDIDLAGLDLDCAIRIGELPDSSMVARPLGRIRWITCAAPSYLAQHGEPMHPNELGRHECLGWMQRPLRKPMPWQFVEAGKPLSLAPHGAVVWDSLDPLVDAACAGMGIVQAADFAVRAACAGGQLRPVLMPFVAEGPTIWLLYPHRQHAPARIKAFGDFVSSLLMADSLPSPAAPFRQ